MQEQVREFILLYPYCTIAEMLNSAEFAEYKKELQIGKIKRYAIFSRIGNRYDLNGNRVSDYVDNPFYKAQEVEVCQDANTIPVVCEIEEKITEEKSMGKYYEIEALIDSIVEKAVAAVKLEHEQEIARLKEEHAQELINAKVTAKAELIAKLND